MTLRNLFIVHAIVGALFGLYFLFFAGAAVTSFGLGDPTAISRLLIRACAVGILSLALVNALCPGDLGNAAVRAVVIGNIFSHLLAIIVDFTESYTRTAGGWIGLAVHVIFILAFGYFWMNGRQTAKA